jgi:hypothetical protein
MKDFMMLFGLFGFRANYWKWYYDDGYVSDMVAVLRTTMWGVNNCRLSELCSYIFVP